MKKSMNGYNGKQRKVQSERINKVEGRMIGIQLNKKKETDFPKVSLQFLCVKIVL